MTQILGLAGVVLIVTIFSLWVYGYASKHGKVWLFAYAACMLFGVQGLSDLGLSLSYGNLYFHLASVILFPSVLLALFVTYIFRGTQEARELLKVLLAVEVGYVIIVFLIKILGAEILFPDGIGWSWLRNHAFSTIALVVGFGVMTILWSRWSRSRDERAGIGLVLGVGLTIWLTLVVDSLIFTVGYFGDRGNLMSILFANIWVRSILAVLLTPLIIAYLRWQEKQAGVQWVQHDWTDVFWREKLTREVEQAKGEIVVLQDLQRQMVEKEAQLSRQNDELRRFEAAVNQSNEMMVFTDAEGIVLWGNPAVEKTTGFTVQEAKGKKVGLLWGKLMEKEWYAKLWQTIKVDKQVFEGEIVNHRKSGEKFISQITIYPIMGTNNEVKFLVATQRDVTQEKAIDRMKSEFISVASHQLRTPLSAMKWFLEMLKNQELGKLNPQQLDAIKNIDASNERMVALVNELLGVSRIESGKVEVKRQKTRTSGWLMTVREQLEPSLKIKNQHLVIDQGWREEVVIDANLLGQVVENLLNNAVKYSPLRAKIKLNLREDDEQLVVEVVDRGIGIPTIEQAQVFERFFRASNAKKEVAEGTGLGLYWAKILTELMGGKILFESKLGKGSRFWVSFPKKEAE